LAFYPLVTQRIRENIHPDPFGEKKTKSYRIECEMNWKKQHFNPRRKQRFHLSESFFMEKRWENFPSAPSFFYGCNFANEAFSYT
jgi:hypothetical protein